MALTVATWNINSLRLRLPLLQRLADDARPDIVCLQETKVPDQVFPREDLAALGYPHVVYAGMKSYNGVAILSRQPLTDAGERQWCGKSDCRHVYATLANGIEIHCLYVPSGGDVPDPAANDKFAHKLEFLRQQADWWARRQNDGARCVLVGDFNVAPLDTDVWSHKQLLNVVSHTPIEVDHLARLANSHGWIDAVRHFIPASQRLYSWWSYRARDWSKSDRGRRIDHIWVTPALVPSLRAARILRDARGWPRPSDHAPVVVSLETP